MEARQPTILWLVRHGQTDWNLEGRYQGHADIPLNPTGLNQAELLAASLCGQSFSAIYSSDLQRARKTAEILGQALGLPVYQDARLREVNQGEWEGVLFSELMRQYSSEMARRLEDLAGETRPPGGESLAELTARMTSVADAIAGAHPGGNVLVVSHGLSIGALLTRARNLPLTCAFSLIPEHTYPTFISWPAPLEQPA